MTSFINGLHDEKIRCVNDGVKRHRIASWRHWHIPFFLVLSEEKIIRVVIDNVTADSADESIAFGKIVRKTTPEISWLFGYAVTQNTHHIEIRVLFIAVSPHSEISKISSINLLLCALINWKRDVLYAQRNRVYVKSINNNEAIKLQTTSTRLNPNKKAPARNNNVCVIWTADDDKKNNDIMGRFTTR